MSWTKDAAGEDGSRPTTTAFLSFCLSFSTEECCRCTESESQWAVMRVTPLQLAVMSRQLGVLEVLLAAASESGLLEEVLMATTEVSFEEDIVNYCHLDRMLHGTSAFHLGVRFGRGPLKLMISFLESRGEEKLLADAIFKKSNNQMKRTPLHCAAYNRKPQALRYGQAMKCINVDVPV